MSEVRRQARSSKAIHLLALLLIVVSASAQATSQRVDGFRIGRFDFCASHESNLELLARVEAQVERAPPALKAWDRVNVELVREGIALAKDLADPVGCRMAFEIGRERFREEMAAAFAVGRKKPAYEPTSDENIRGARLDLAGQWTQEEANRLVLASLEEDSRDPAVRWARAQAEARMAHVALNSIAVVSDVYEEFGMPESAVLGALAAWQATQLAELYGVPAETLQSASRGARRSR